MAGLLDIGVLTKKVEIRGVSIEVKGLSALVLFKLLDQFPELRKVFSNAGVEPDPALLMTQVPGIVALIVCAATNTPEEDKPQVVAKFIELSIGEQAELFKAIWELTFPRGLSHFTAALEELGLKAPTGSGWDQGTPSPGPLSNLSQPDTQPNKSGTTPQE